MSSSHPGDPSKRARGLFIAIAATLVVLVGIPRAPLTPEESSLLRDAHLLRLAEGELAGAISDYRRDHVDWPGIAPEGGLDRPTGPGWFVRQLTRSSDARGRVSVQRDRNHPLGPYLDEIPPNPINGRADVRILTRDEERPSAPDGTTGWTFDPRSGEVSSNGSSGSGDDA